MTHQRLSATFQFAASNVAARTRLSNFHSTACGQNFIHLLARNVRVLLGLEVKTRDETVVVLPDNKAETLGSPLYWIDFRHGAAPCWLKRHPYSILDGPARQSPEGRRRFHFPQMLRMRLSAMLAESTGAIWLQGAPITATAQIAGSPKAERRTRWSAVKSTLSGACPVCVLSAVARFLRG
jgi:hypothetical protein